VLSLLVYSLISLWHVKRRNVQRFEFLFKLSVPHFFKGQLFFSSRKFHVVLLILKAHFIIRHQKILVLVVRLFHLLFGLLNQFVDSLLIIDDHFSDAGAVETNVLQSIVKLLFVRALISLVVILTTLAAILELTLERNIDLEVNRGLQLPVQRGLFPLARLLAMGIFVERKTMSRFMVVRRALFLIFLLEWVE